MTEEPLLHRGSDGDYRNHRSSPANPRPDPGLWALLVLGFLNLLLLLYLAAASATFPSGTVLFVMLSCIFAAAALEPLAVIFESLPILGRLVVWPKAAAAESSRRWSRRLPVTIQPMHQHREGHSTRANG